MKKVILLLVLILCTMIGAKQLSESEKNEMLKQFEIFQNAVKNKDIETVKSMVKFPLNEESGYALILDENADLSGGITEKTFLKYKNGILERLDEITKVKVNYSKNNFSEYYKDGANTEDKKRKYYQKGDEPGYYYKDKNNKEVYHTICDLKVNGEFSDNGILEIKSSSFSNKLTPLASEDCDSSIIYYFKLINNKLKLYEVKMTE